MPARRHGDTGPPELGFLPVLLANLLPLVGVLFLGWDPETLVVVYTLELLVLFPLAGVKALFAGRPPVSDRESGVVDVSESDLVGRRGSVTVHDRLPPIYPRNVPFATAVVGGSAWLGLLVLAPVSEAVAVLAVLRRPEVLLSVVALVAGQLGETVFTYIGTRQYVDQSPYAVVEIPARQGMVLACLLFVVALGGATVALAGFVVVKVLFEWSGFRTERDGGGRVTEWFSGPDADSTVDPVAVPDGQPSAAVDVDRRAAVVDAVWTAVTTTGPSYVTMATFVWLGTVAFLVDGQPPLFLWLGMAVVALLLFGFLLGGDVVEGVLERRWVTYRRIDDTVVAYDRLTDEPQWATSVGAFRDATVVEDRPADRYFDTRTVTATTGWGDDETDRTLGPVGDWETLVGAFDLPVRSTELSPLDRRFVVAAVASVGVIAAVGVALVATPFGGPNGWLFALVTCPALVAVPTGLWRLAAP